MCVGSAVVCALTILVELSASFAYYGRAFKIRYRKARTLKLRSEAEAKMAAGGDEGNMATRCCARMCKRPTVHVPPKFPRTPDDGKGFSWEGVAKSAAELEKKAIAAEQRRKSMSDMTNISEAALMQHEAETKAVRVGKSGDIVFSEAKVNQVVTEEDKSQYHNRIMEYVSSMQQVGGSVGVASCVNVWGLLSHWCCTRLPCAEGCGRAS